MKTLIILILLVALAAAAFFTRPSEASFQEMVKQQATQKSAGNFLEKIFSGMSTDSFLKDCKYKDKFLWTEIENDGKTVYIGAFSHWFEKDTKDVKKTDQTQAAR